MSNSVAPPPSRLPVLIRDWVRGFHQQMYFWGKDAIHPSGNLFQQAGFTKRPSLGLQGTSCYALPWQDGHLELHGSHAGWFGKDGGFLFIRPMNAVVRWLSSEPPIPGQWPREQYCSKINPDLLDAAQPFLDWWITYESSIFEKFGFICRDSTFEQYRKLPKSRPWLPPIDALAWVKGLRNHPADLPRVRHFSQNQIITS